MTPPDPGVVAAGPGVVAAGAGVVATGPEVAPPRLHSTFAAQSQALIA